MNSLEVKYLGLTLKNPIVVSSSGQTASVEKVKKMEEAGAGAVVLKSLFQEQIMHEAYSFENEGDYPEAHDYIMNYAVENSVEEYLNLIRESKKVVGIPVIASISCVSAGEWVTFARKIEAAGADALELNIFILPTDKSKSAAYYESIYLDVAAKVREVVTIPVSVKMAKGFTNVAYMVDQLYMRKVNGVVLFNRLYEPDINIHDMKMGSAEVFSNASDLRDTLRWVGMVSSAVNQVDVAASTGVHSGEAAVKLLLAGATVVEVCSLIYQKGAGAIAEVLNTLQTWMDKHGYRTVGEFKGKLSYKNFANPEIYERSQFMRYFSSHE